MRSLLLPIGVHRVVGNDIPAPARSMRAGGGSDFKSALANAASNRSEASKSDRADAPDRVRSKSATPDSDSSRAAEEPTDQKSIAAVQTQLVVAGPAVGEDIFPLIETATSETILELTPPQPANAGSPDSNKYNEQPENRSGSPTAFDTVQIELNARSQQVSLDRQAAAGTAARADTAPPIAHEADSTPASNTTGVASGEKVDGRVAILPGTPPELNAAAVASKTSTAGQISISETTWPQAVANRESVSIGKMNNGTPYPTNVETLPEVAVASSPSRAVLTTEAQERPSDTAHGAETVFERKVRRWMDHRREGSRELAAPAINAMPSANGKSNEAITDARVSLLMQKMLGRSGRAAFGTSVDVIAERGDQAATSLGRWLVKGATELKHDAAASREAQPSPVSMIGGSPSTVASISPVGSATHVAGSPASFVAELLASREDGGAAIENAVRGMNSGSVNGRQQATLRLDPPELGHLRVLVRMNEGAMTLHVRTEHQSVTRLIESRMIELRDALAEHGIRMEQTSVVTRSAESGEARNQTHPDRAPNDDSRGDGAARFGHDNNASAENGAQREHESGQSGLDESPAWYVLGDAESHVSDDSKQWTPSLDGSVNLMA